MPFTGKRTIHKEMKK